MGRMKEYLMEIDVRKFQDINKYVCEDCVQDFYLKKWIHNSSDRTRKCDYCGKKKETVLMTDLMNEIIMPTINGYYSLAVDELGYDSAEGGYQGETYDKEEVLSSFSEYISQNNQLINDIEDSLSDDIWCRGNPYGLSELETYEYSWHHFSELVKHKNRYFFLNEETNDKYDELYSPLLILNSICDVVEKQHLIKTLPKNTNLYRARAFEKEKTIINGANLGSPPNKSAPNNRMNAAGISVFYASEDQMICIKEIQNPKSNRNIVVGNFQNINAIRYLDLTEIRNIQLPSIFNLEERHIRNAIIFLKELNEELTKPITSLKEIEYVPTQIFAEYFKIVVGLNGIKYNSSKDKNGTCFVLFFDNEQCINDKDKPIYNKKCELKLISYISK